MDSEVADDLGGDFDFVGGAEVVKVVVVESDAFAKDKAILPLIDAVSSISPKNALESNCISPYKQAAIMIHNNNKHKAHLEFFALISGGRMVYFQ